MSDLGGASLAGELRTASAGTCWRPPTRESGSWRGGKGRGDLPAPASLRKPFARAKMIEEGVPRPGDRLNWLLLLQSMAFVISLAVMEWDGPERHDGRPSTPPGPWGCKQEVGCIGGLGWRTSWCWTGERRPRRVAYLSGRPPLRLEAWGARSVIPARAAQAACRVMRFHSSGAARPVAGTLCLAAILFWRSLQSQAVARGALLAALLDARGLSSRRPNGEERRRLRCRRRGIVMMISNYCRDGWDRGRHE